MKKTFAIFLSLVICLIFVQSALATTDEEARAIAESVVNTTTDTSLVQSPFIDVVNNVQKSVVGVNNYQVYTYSSYNPYFGFGGFSGFGGFGDYYGGSRESVEQLAATGSGVIVYDGLVLTNYHVIESASRLTVSALDSDSEVEAVVILYDEAADIAILRVPDLDISPVTLGDSDKLRVGEWAICIGNPLAEELRGTVTVGIISALDRQIDSTARTDKYGLRKTVTNSMIQTDAAINSGNSGGGLFNVLGQLMGVPSAKYSGSYYSGMAVEGIGLAIPINTAKPLIADAIERTLKGDFQKANDDNATAAIKKSESGDKPMLGVTIRPINSSNHYLVYQGSLPGGVLITEIKMNTPADKAGLKQFDIIVEIGEEIADSNNVIKSNVEACSYGDIINIKVYRVEGFDGTEASDELGKGEYLSFDVELFRFE